MFFMLIFIKKRKTNNYDSSNYWFFIDLNKVLYIIKNKVLLTFQYKTL